MNLKAIVAGAVAAVVVAGAAILTVQARSSTPTQPKASPTSSVTAQPEIADRGDRHVLSSAPAGSPALVVFLDYESEYSRAAYPDIKALREDYDGRAEILIRNFPTANHKNAMNAAVAVEAAARQNRLEQMVARMYDTQADWSEQDATQAPLFRQFAENLNLDMRRYDADVASQPVRDRIEADRQDGVDLGVKETPALFLDGERITPASVEGLRQLLNKALAQRLAMPSDAG